ncbi:DUF5989 family protein [Bradyrhizobium elkanii]|uniref:Uncharacterized protein n=1 Tax=Bradyrhizobium elkanii TaxID=29448 RepID=A0A8I1YP70_BRAEL|nr:DUF5989 family protein [Bradyrhizobium elkanii]MBP1299793.1 hypothetical protein [Bradyrhizobium elkanii]
MYLFITELLTFMRVRKKLWLSPLIVLMVVLESDSKFMT